MQIKLNSRQKIGLLAALVFSSLVLLSLYAITSIDTSRIISIIGTQLKEYTGRELTVNGPVSIKLFPRLAVEAEQVSLTNPAWAADADMLKAQRVSFALQWLPLLSKRIEIDNVSLDGAQLVLQSLRNTNESTGNWKFDAEGAGVQNAATSENFALNLTEINLNKVSVIYKNTDGKIVDTMLVKQFDMKRDVNKVQIDGAVQWNGLQLTLNGQTDSWQQLIENWGLRSTDFALNVNLGVNKERYTLNGHIKISPNSMPMLDLKVKSHELDLRMISSILTQGTNGADNKSKSSPDRIFSAERFSFNALPVYQGQIDAEIDTLILSDGITLENFNATLAATTDDAFILRPLSFKVGSGHVVADGRLNEAHSSTPSLQMRGYASGLNLGQLISQMDKGNLVNGGTTQAAFNISSRGSSASALASNATGTLQISVGSATASNSLVNLGGDFLLSVANAVNPLRKSSDTTQLQCIAAYLPIKNGLVQINKSIGLETDRLDLTLDGRVDLGSEYMRINIYPKEKLGLTTGFNPAGLVQITGTLANPRVGINKSGVVKQAAGVGLAIVTGGISLLAQNAVGVASYSSPCDNVLHPWSQVANGLVTSTDFSEGFK